ncbi:Histidine--tRNA ligase, partial [Clarias magur]
MTNILIGREYGVSSVLRLFDRSDSSKSDPVMVGPRSALLSLSPPSPHPLSLYAFSNCLQYISVHA